ncbi:MAG: zinc ribbon domain-containing protein, partial [bacterium]
MESVARGLWDEWMWMARNGVAVLAALVLAGILSQAQVFQEAVLGSNGFNAAAAVRLLGYGTALVLIWVTAWHAAAQIPPRDSVSRLLHEGLPPFATLLILPGVYGLIRPFLGEHAVTGVSWIFVLLLLATAVWLGRALHDNAEALVVGAAFIRRRVSESAERRGQMCQKCEAPNTTTAKFCTSCGTSLGQPANRDDRVTAVSGKERASTDLRRSA